MVYTFNRISGQHFSDMPHCGIPKMAGIDLESYALVKKFNLIHFSQGYSQNVFSCHKNSENV